MSRNLRQRVLDVFKARYPDGTSTKAMIHDLNRRGLLNNPKEVVTALFIVIDHLEELNPTPKSK